MQYNYRYTSVTFQAHEIKHKSASFISNGKVTLSMYQSTLYHISYLTIYFRQKKKSSNIMSVCSTLPKLRHHAYSQIFINKFHKFASFSFKIDIDQDKTIFTDA